MSDTQLIQQFEGLIEEVGEETVMCSIWDVTDPAADVEWWDVCRSMFPPCVLQEGITFKWNIFSDGTSAITPHP